MIPSLNYAVLTDALHALKEGDIRHCESLGFTFDEMNALNLLSLDELFIVSRSAAPFVSVSIRHDVLHHYWRWPDRSTDARNRLIVRSGRADR